VDAARIPAPEGLTSGGRPSGSNNPCYMSKSHDPREERAEGHPSGRWPANVVLSDDPEVEAAFAAFGSSTSPSKPVRQGGYHGGGFDVGKDSGAAREGFGIGYGDAGTPSRFFFTAKADARDRAGSRHPTVKPTDLMRWLVRLVCPPGGLVLDPFAGSGSTGLAADQCGMRSVLVERDPAYAGDALRKIREDAPLFAEPAGSVPDLDAAYQRTTPDLFSEAAD